MTRILLRDLSPGSTYKVQLRSRSEDTFSEWSPMLTFVTNDDVTPPAVPVGATWLVSGTSFIGTWNPIDSNLEENLDFSHYEVLISDGVASAQYSIPSTTSPRFDLTLEANRAAFGTPKASVSFRVRSVDRTGNKSEYTTLINAQNPAPAPVTALTPTSSMEEIALSWTAPSDTDVVGYNVYASATNGYTPGTGTKIGFVDGTTYIHKILSGTRYYHVRAVDVYGQESTSTQSAAVSPKVPVIADTTAPNAPTGVSVTSGFDTTNQQSWINVSWTASTSTDLAEHEVRWSQDGTNYSYQSVVRGTNSLRILVDPGKSYTVAVRAVDWTNNSSAFVSATGSPIASVADTAAPSQPSAPSVTGGVMNAFISHDNTKQGGGAIESDTVAYEVYASTTTGFTPASANRIGRVERGTVTSGSFSIPATKTNPTWYFKVIAVDRSGNRSVASNETSATIGVVAAGNVDQAILDSITGAQQSANNALASDDYVLNPYFDNWTSALPDNWSQSNGTPIKETSIFRTGPYALRYNVTAGTNSFVGQTITSLDNPQYITAVFDFYLVSGDLGGAGALIRWASTTTTFDVPISFATELGTATPATGKWYRVSKTVKRPANFTGTYASNTIYPMAGWTSIGTITAKNLIFDRASMRPSSSAEVLAYEAPTVSSMNTAITTSANGKNKITYSSSVASGTTGYINGDVWYRLSGATVIGFWIYNGTTWISQTLTNSVISSLDAGKINTGLLDAARIAAGSIDTTKLSVYDMTDYAGDGKFLGTTNWNKTVTVNAGAPNYVELLSVNGSNNDAYSNYYFSASTGDSYYVSYEYWADPANTSWNFIGAGIRSTNNAGTNNWASVGQTTAQTQASAGTWTTVSGTVTLSQADAQGARAWFTVSNNGNVNNKYRFRNFTLRKRNGGELIVDGAITAAKVGTNEIISVSANIKDAVISNAKIADLAVTNAKIADATIQSAKIASLEANKLTAGQGIINDLIIGRSADTVGSISSFGYTDAADGVGFKLHKSGLTIHDGLIKAKALRLQQGQNIIPPQYADFEFLPGYYQNNVFVAQGAGMQEVLDEDKLFGTQCLSLAWMSGSVNPIFYFGKSDTDYNTVVEADKSYIASAYVWVPGTTATNVKLKIKWSNGTISTFVDQTVAAGTSGATAVRITGTATAPSGVNSGVMFIESGTQTASDIHIDGVQLEEKWSTLNTPSSWTPSARTYLDANQLRTGFIDVDNLIAQNAIEGKHIRAGTITGDLFQGEVVTTSNFILGDRSEWVGETGVLTIYQRALGSNGERVPLIRLDPDGGSIFRGSVEADDVSVMNGIVLKGVLSKIDTASGLTVQAGVADPNALPSVSNTFIENDSWAAVPSGYEVRGMSWDDTDACWIRLIVPTSGGHSGACIVQRISGTTGNWLGSVTLDNIVGITENRLSGVLRIGDYYYTGVEDFGTVSGVSDFFVASWNVSNGADYKLSNIPFEAPTQEAPFAIGLDSGGNILLAVYNSSTNPKSIRFGSFSLDGSNNIVYSNTITRSLPADTTPNGPAGLPPAPLFVSGENLDYGTAGYTMGSSKYVLRWDKTGDTQQTANKWVVEGSDTVNGISYRPGVGWRTGHNNGKWRAYSSLLTQTSVWVSYDFQDGTGKRTKASPARQINVAPRRYLSVQIPTPPTGATIRNVFVGTGTTQPTDANMIQRLETLSTSGNMMVDLTVAGGALRPSPTNTFGTGESGWIRPSITGWELLGNGQMTVATPTATNHPTTKSYVDGRIQGASEVSIPSGSGGQNVTVTFPVPFASTPAVVLTVSHPNITHWRVTSQSSTGFTARFDRSAAATYSFNWIAAAI